MASDLLTAEKFLSTKLQASSAISAVVGSRVFSEIAPAKTAYPLVIYKWQGGQDVGVLRGVSVFLDEVYAVKVITNTNDFSAVEAVAAAIQTALHNVTGSVTGGNVLMCQRMAPLKFTEQVDGVIYRHLGATYRIYSK